MRRHIVPAALLLAALPATSCGGAETSGSSDTTTTTTTTETTTTTPPPTPVIDLAVDANRDGLIDAADETGEDAWTADRGAAFLANLDDDDKDHLPDAEDEIVNGLDDEADLATVLVAAWADAPDGATGVLHVDVTSAEKVRVYKKNPDATWALVGGAIGPCNKTHKTCTPTPDFTLSTEEVRAGVTLGVEAITFRRSLADGEWTGSADLTYAIKDAEGQPYTTTEIPDGQDRVKLRVAPWILFGNLSPFEKVYSDDYMPEFATGVGQVAKAAGIEHQKLSDFVYPDQWTQDWFQTAWTSVPRGDGKVQGMKIANARPWGSCGTTTCLPINWIKKFYLQPGAGVLEIYKVSNSGSTYDSHGNHDLVPAYDDGDKSYPLGRIIHGSDVLPETHAFYEAQEVQGPVITTKTSWLYVGHLDEVFSFVPANVPRGWKVLVGSPKMARQMLLDAQAAGYGAVTMFKGKEWLPEAGGSLPAEISIDDVLADQDLMAASQDSQAEIDGMVEQLKADVAGLTDEDFVEVPYLLQEVSGQKLAFNPGTANILIVDGKAGVPKPYGPVIDGADIFEKDYLDRIGSPMNGLGEDGQGLEVFFVEDWEAYHALDGEVHCGTNLDAGPQADLSWWEVLK